MPRLKTHIEINALLRRAQSGGAFGVILRKGDQDAGAYMVVVRCGAQVTLYSAERDMTGQVTWHPKGPMDDLSANEIINRRVDFDPDVWVVEIEDAQGRSFLESFEPDSKPSAAQAAGEALFQARSPRKSS